MEPGGAGGAGEGPSSSSAAGDRTSPPPPPPPPPPKAQPPPLQQQQQPLSRYESQKRRDWNTFLQYLKNHTPPLALPRCSGAHVIEFLKYLDQFGKTKVHSRGCTFFGQPDPPSSCACPLRQAWGSLDALIGRLRAAHEESGGNLQESSNPFAARAVRIYLREVRQTQAEARGIPYEKKKRKRTTATSSAAQPSSSSPPATTPTSSTTAPDKSSDPPGGGSSSVS